MEGWECLQEDAGRQGYLDLSKGSICTLEMYAFCSSKFCLGGKISRKPIWTSRNDLHAEMPPRGNVCVRLLMLKCTQKSRMDSWRIEGWMGVWTAV